MHKNIFYKIGKLTYSCRWLIIATWVVLLLACLPFITDITKPFKSTGFIDETSNSAKTTDYINEKLGFDYDNKLLVLYTSKSLSTNGTLFFKKIKASLSDLDDFPIKNYIFYPNDNKKQVAKNKRSAYAVIVFKTHEPLTDKQLQKFKDTIKKPSNMTMKIGGDPIFVENVNHQMQKDLYHADMIAAPLALITLLFVFGSLIAAAIPIVLGAGAALLILTTLFVVGHILELSIFTLNIALLLGLCLTLDYSLFIISRFRDELTPGVSIKKAIALTQATAGKAIFFSGLAVLTSLSALLLFPINILFSMAIGGVTAVMIAVLTAVILLPAVLAVLNTKINSLPIRLIKKEKAQRYHFWRSLAEHVVKRPMRYFISIFLFLILLGLPLVQAKFGVPDFRIFPKGSESRDFFDTYSEKFNEQDLTPIILVTKSHDSPILSRDNLKALDNLTDKIKKNKLVSQVSNIVTIDTNLTSNQYYTLYHLQKNLIKPHIKALLATTTGRYFTIVNISSKHPINSPETKELVDDLHKIKSQNQLKTELTGRPVSNIEVLDVIIKKLPFAVLWVVFFTYLLLLILLRSVFLPLKAIFMNLLSLAACYGALVLIFQEGYLHQFFNFEPQGMLDISLLVIIFCALFGFSMDYEVFLLTRIKEYHDKYHDNEKSIIFGIEKSSRIITSAAIIVIFICASFLVADILMVKSFGLGIAVAIFVDAFLIRSFLVPATMSLIKEWNWYLPKWLDKILPKI